MVMTDNVGEVVKCQAKENFRIYETYGRPLKAFKQKFHNCICSLVRL